MKRYLIKILPLVALALFIIPGLSHADYDYIDINNPFLRKIPMAIPVFSTLPNAKAKKTILKRASNLLSDTLEFTGYFKMLDRDAFLIDPDNAPLITPKINFNNWVSIGAEFLITGGLAEKNNTIAMELRLFDTFKGKRLVGKKYEGPTKDLRQMVRRFCSEVIYHLTGNRGIFNSKIAFISTGSGNKEIFICDFDGSNIKQLTQNNRINLFPAWSSDAKWMAYTSYLNGKPDIYIINLKNKHRTSISKKGLNIAPAWKPARFELAATLSFSGDQEIYLLTGTGKIIKRLTRKWGSDVSPTWSPDGKKIAFVSNRAGSPQIYIKDIASGQVERLTFNGQYNTQPDWSPRGDKIVYSSLQQGRNNIFVVDIKNRQPTQLTFDSGNNEAPSWSSDGSLIVFSSTRKGPSRLYIMTAFGTDQRRLLFLRGEQTNPKWSPNVNNE
ncbi:MAG: Tol-Pal system beta propeller repeat protein TolB [Thermodesulfobacteriota bacterium]|nr:Tol-Pal system beta propeller repeat protein TolB [Thermodesulfobacteriota bacterium]